MNGSLDFPLWVTGGMVAFVFLVLAMTNRKGSVDYETDLGQNKMRRHLKIEPLKPKPMWSEARVDGQDGQDGESWREGETEPMPPYDVRAWARGRLGVQTETEEGRR